MDDTDRAIACTRRVYELAREYDDDSNNTDRRLAALNRAVGELARRVGVLEQALDVLKNGSPGKTPQRAVPKVPRRRVALSPQPGKQIRRLEGRIIRK